MKGTLALALVLGLTPTLWSLSSEELQVLINRSQKGQTITVPPGTYQGSLVVRNPVVVRFQPGAKLVHAPGAKGPTLWIQSSDVTVRGLEIVGTGEGSRRDNTALLVTGSRVTVEQMKIREGWSGVWLDGCSDVTLDDLEVTGWADFPFWERGEAVRITNGTNLRLTEVRIRSVADGIYAERCAGLVLSDCQVVDARYGVHSMFSTNGTVRGLKTSQTVVGVMLMESSSWVVRDSSLDKGYRTGSAGVREIRTKDVTIEGNHIARQASGVELIDVRGGIFRDNQITENGTAWTWGRDNTGTLIQSNLHRGNLRDFAGEEPLERVLMGPDPHQHAEAKASPGSTENGTVSATTLPVRPRFEGNSWDGWRGTDLDQDGTGDTPYRFDRVAAARAATRPWEGIFLGSPWSLWSRGIPGGEVIDEHPELRDSGQEMGR